MEVYDAIASEYQESKQLPFRGALEAYTLFQLLGDIGGAAVYDLACGDGFYTRRIKQAGAAAVTGVDISAEMVELAREAERREPLGCRYVCQDAAEFAPEEPADIVTAVYLFNYASTPAQLLRMCQAARGALRPGGRLVAVNDNCFNPPTARSGVWAKYGFDRTLVGALREGAPIRYRFTTQRGEDFTFDNHYLEPETYHHALSDAGFVNVEWVDLQLAPDSRSDPFWDDFLASPPLIALSADVA